MATNRQRPIREIAQEIANTWTNQILATGSYAVIHPWARPYLNAMFSLEKPTDYYGADTAEEIVIRFLGNATSFKGEDARRLKAELKALFSFGKGGK